MARQFLNAHTDPEALALLADLEALAARAETLSTRYDREHVAVGKFWGVTRDLRAALGAARGECGPGEDA